MKVENVIKLDYMGMPIVQYKIDDYLRPGALEYLQQPRRLVTEEEVAAWERAYEPRCKEEFPDIPHDYNSLYSWYTIKPLDTLLFVNMATDVVDGVVIQLCYATGETSILVLVDVDETRFLQFCLDKANKPVYAIPNELINTLTVLYTG